MSYQYQLVYLLYWYFSLIIIVRNDHLELCERSETCAKRLVRKVFCAKCPVTVENSFSWWNSLFLFFNLKHEIDRYTKHTKYFLRVPCGIHSGLLCYHKKQKQQLLKTVFVTISTKFESVFWICHNKWKFWRYSVLVIFIKSNNFPRVSLQGVF